MKKRNKKTYSWDETCEYIAHKVLKFPKDDINYRAICILPRIIGSQDDIEYKRCKQFISSIVSDLTPFIGYNFSRKEISNKIQESFLSEFLLKKIEISKKDVIEKLNEIKNIHDSSNNEHTILFPLSNVVVRDQSVIIKDVEFLKIKDIPLKKSPLNQMITPGILPESFAKVTVRSSIDKAFLEAKRKVQCILDAFQFCEIYDWEENHRCNYTIWNGERLFESISFVKTDSNDFFLYNTLRHMRLGRIFLPLTNDQEKFLYDNHFDFVYELFINRDSRKDVIDQVLYKAIMWYVKGEQSENIELKMIAYTAALETIFKCGRGYCKNIERGIHYVLLKKYNSRNKFQKRIEELYNFRSGLVHGSLDDFKHIGAVEDQRFCAKSAICFIIENIKNFQGKTRESIVHYFKEIENESSDFNVIGTNGESLSLDKEGI